MTCRSDLIQSGPVLCRLEHRLFALLGAVAFRRSASDGAAMLVIPLGEREASVPLGALQRELSIADDSLDGRMLHLIAAALEFVSGLGIGDQLPSEVVTGEASWRPQQRHQDVAMARLRQSLLAWLRPDADVSAIDRDPAMRAVVQEAFGAAARALGLASGQAVLDALGALAGELAFIEALRDQLHDPVQVLNAGLQGMDLRRQPDGRRRETLRQVSRLCAIAAGDIGARFGAVDAQSGAVLQALRHADSQRSLIRSHRDSLYRMSLGWRPLLAEWAAAEQLDAEARWRLIVRTYHFLARRHMPVTEWRRRESRRYALAALRPAAMVW